MNPALENQAIGRVYRLGQNREVQVTRLVQEDSVETRILKYLNRKYGSRNDNQNSSHVNLDSRVGNVASDKAVMAMQDFDLLFGVAQGEGGDRHAEGRKDKNNAQGGKHGNRFDEDDDNSDESDYSSDGYYL